VGGGGGGGGGVGRSDAQTDGRTRKSLLVVCKRKTVMQTNWLQNRRGQRKGHSGEACGYRVM
jgi:hypothetical protein